MESVYNRRFSLLVCMATMVCSGALTLATTVAQYGGSYANWPSTWTAFAGINDPAAAGRLDFVGDATDWGGYWAQNNDYVFLRMRVNTATVDGTTYSGDTLWALINTANPSAPLGPNFAFAWNATTGLKMQTLGTLGSTWGGTTMAAVGAVADINGNSRTGDGYVRSVDGQGATNSTSFIDFAVSWNYLQNNSTTTLRHEQVWAVALASAASAVNTSPLGTGGDIAGGSTPASAPSSPTGGWSGAFLNPEPASAGVLAVCLACGILGRRPRTRQG